MTTIASSVTRGLFENGRRYHSYGQSRRCRFYPLGRVSRWTDHHAEYAFPNDERELERLDMQHAMQTMLLDGELFWSPIGNSPQKVLDLGTGTGNTIYPVVWGYSHTDCAMKGFGPSRWRTSTPRQKYKVPNGLHAIRN